MKYLISLLIFCASCSPAWHLQQALKKGADIKSDTTYTKMSFDITGASTTFKLDPVHFHRKDGVEYVPILKDTIIYKDRIKIQIKDNTVAVKCPDEKKDITVPVAINNDIKAGYTKLQYLTAGFGGILFGLIVGFLVGKIIKVGI